MLSAYRHNANRAQYNREAMCAVRGFGCIFEEEVWPVEGISYSPNPREEMHRCL